jgi:hypothetical protein
LRKQERLELSWSIHPRSCLHFGQILDAEIELFARGLEMPEHLRTAGLSARQRYASLKSEAATLASQACQTWRDYGDLRAMLNDFSERLVRPVGHGLNVIEMSAMHPGQHGIGCARKL